VIGKRNDRRTNDPDHRRTGRQTPRHATPTGPLEAVLAAIRDGFFVLDKDWRCTYANPAAAALLQTTPDRLLGRSIWETWPPAQDSRCRDEFTRAVEQRVFVRFEAFYEPARRWYEYRCYPTEGGLTVQFYDATERKQAEGTLRRRSQMLEAFFLHTISPLAFLDRDFNFVRVNEAFAQGDGKNPDFFVGKNLFTVYPPDGNRAIFEQVVQTKQPYRASAVPSVFPHAPQRERGATYWDWWLTPLLDERGEVQFLVWSLEDVTEQRNAMQELRERARQLQQLSLELSEAEDRERKRLAEILHDDLQQILAAAKFHIGLLGSQVKSEAERREMTEQVKQMLTDAIDKSRSLSHELNPPGLSHNDLYEAFAWLASEVRTRHGLLVHRDTCPRVELSSEPLKAILYRAAQEMLFNVIKHAHVKEARLRLCRHGGRVYLSVADRGRGFDLQRLGRTGGLGLVRLRERVELLGGRMKIKSAPGRGSIFVVAVPDSGKPAPATESGLREKPEAAPVVSPVAAHESPTDHFLRVLLVDDHKIVREGIQIMLADEPDIEIVGQAGNGREAVELAHRLRPDVVVMDVSMPVMSGDEATRQIRQDLPQTRVVALSMHDSAAVAERMRQAGAAAYLLKTAPAEDLLAAIRGREVTAPAS
jgi:PAS domain S-box-containing protein